MIFCKIGCETLYFIWTSILSLSLHYKQARIKAILRRSDKKEQFVSGKDEVV